MINERMKNMLEAIEVYEMEEIEQRLKAEMHERMANVYKMYNRENLAKESLRFANSYTEEANDKLELIENLRNQVASLEELAIMN